MSTQKEEAKPTSGNHNRELGKRGELAAQAFLRVKGFDIIEANWKCQFGEVDIIARDDDALHFIEVKTRSTIKYGFPSEAVTKEKRERYERMAMVFLADYEDVDMMVSFDIISIVRTGPDRAFMRFNTNVFSG